jgi:protein required for attachment to host cells
LKTQFVIADGSRARWVNRSDRADDFVTSMELKAEHVHHGEPTGVVFESSSGQRFNLEERSQAERRHHIRFAEDVAESINAAAAKGELSRLAIVAGPRMLNAISQRLSVKAKAKLASTLPKDLTKTPDHELGRWLKPLEFG